jgi:hypothetical protein
VGAASYQHNRAIGTTGYWPSRRVYGANLKHQILAFIVEGLVQGRIRVVEACIRSRLDTHVLLLIPKPPARCQRELTSSALLFLP